MFVYVVTSGSYSDYGIDAIFSTKELAETYVSRMDNNSSYSGYNIEEWPIDAGLPRLFYGVRLAREFDQENKKLTEEAILSEMRPEHRVERPKTNVYLRGDSWEGIAWGSSYDVARKSLWDALAKAKAEKEGL